MPLPDPDSLQCFLAAARTLNFRAAAHQVSLTPAALSKRIQQLERTLGAKLFQRTTRRVSLTEAGLALIPRAESALAEAEACLRAARGEEGPPPQEITLGTRHELGLSWLLPQLEELECELPHLTFHLYVGSGPDLDLKVRSGEVSCAVSSRQTTDPAIDSLQLHQEDYAFCARPALIKRQPLKRPDHAANHTLIDAHRYLPLFGYWRDAAPPEAQLRFGRVRSLGTISAIRWAVLKGQGVAVLPRYLVDQDLAKGRLTEVFPRIRPAPDHFRLLFLRNDPRRSLFVTLATRMRATPLK